MKYLLHISLSALFIICIPICSISQANERIDDSDEAKIFAKWKALEYHENTFAKTIRLNQRKFDSPFFCDEIVKYKDGYIINSITSSRGKGTVEFRTKFYYYNNKDRNIYNLIVPEADTIESLLVDPKNTIYCSYKKFSNQFVSSFVDGMQTDLLAFASDEIRMQIDTAKWLKLGFYDNCLYGLTPTGLFTYTGRKWNQLLQYNSDSFYLRVLKYKRPFSFLPTKNIVVTKDYVWYLQEIVQERRCRLLKLNIHTGQLSDFFISNDYTDNYLKEINDFSIISDQSEVVCMNRLIGSQMLLKTDVSTTEVWIYNNQLKNSKQENSIEATSILVDADTIFLAGTNGLFKKISDTISPLMFWQNGRQEIKEDKSVYHFEFFPRCLLRISDTEFLIGGMWGGLYKCDLLNRKIICLDDVSYKKVKNLDISKL